MIIRSLILLVLLIPTFCVAQNIGVNTSNPQQKLHIGGADSNMRIDAFSGANNSNNTSPTVTAPLYVNHEGVLTLEFEPYYASDGNDDFNGNSGSSIITQDIGNTEIVENIIFQSTEIYVPRPSYIQVTYSMSFYVKYDRNGNPITDKLARIIQNYITVDGVLSEDGSGNLRKYAMAAQCYINGSVEGANEVLYNSGSAYIHVEEGFHTLNFHGGVGSRSETASTVVHFGLGQDMLLIRMF